ncbi:unnamed protein product [Phytophthora fragariaefolia]|uniref:Unnamed protein product n=1 Tax=Phytophthora fragariaefolia TaxID=1490495 RepID=A0A9W6YB79_9STRA|nr:unnamed protein product [Phytophthora fragariaefolia]
MKQDTIASALSLRQLPVSSISPPQVLCLSSSSVEVSAFSLDGGLNSAIPGDSDSASPNSNDAVEYWSEEYQRSYLYDPVTGVSTWL